MPEKVIQIKHLVKQLNEFCLGPIDLELQHGYVYAVVGPNGSGKSTLFRLLLGLRKPDQGEIRLFGRPADDSMLKKRIGYVPEKADTTPDYMTAKQLADFRSYWYPEWNSAQYEQLLQKYEVDPNQKLKQMSKGVRRRLDLALALAAEPDLLLLDEPSSGLDPFVKKSMWEEFQRWMEEAERTILMATHSLEEIKKTADYVILLYKGAMLGMFEKDSLFDRWKIFWVTADAATAGHPVPGVVDGQPQPDGSMLLISSDSEKSEAHLRDAGAIIHRVQSMDLDDILQQLIRTRSGGADSVPAEKLKKWRGEAE
jgi:ABC-2 type transport system ATP-binding protein